MKHDQIINKLSDNIIVFDSLLKTLPLEQVTWKPLPEAWSFLGILNHLIDEERWDFKQRIEVAIESPGKEWIPIKPLKWAKEDRYNNGNFNELLKDFLQLRKDNVKWLKSFKNPDWKASDDYPWSIKLTAEDALVNWLAHDYLHIRQINKMNWLYLSQMAPATNLNYAGEW